MHSFGARPLTIYYEHPDWFRPLFNELDRRGILYDRAFAGHHRFDPGESLDPGRVVFNRMSPSAWGRGHANAIFYTGEYLAHLERQGTRVINGARAWQTEISKVRQVALLSALGLPVPRARVINHAAQVMDAAAGFRFPVITKPNIGGSGVGVRRFDTPEALQKAAQDGAIDLGVDHTGLVQEFIPAESQRIVRVEVLNGKYLYAIRIYTPGDSFNLCPADVCQSTDGTELERLACPADAPRNGMRVEGFQPPPQVIADVERIMNNAGIEIGGVEYFIDARDGELYYYDINALSNFVADAPRVIGFDPFVRLADWIEAEIAQAVPALEVA